MSLFSSIQQASNALSVNQLGLNVTGNNIANANTPGYIRQELIQSSGPGVPVGGIILGYGVRANGVVQKVDDFLVKRMQEAQSKLAASQVVQNSYNDLESIVNELTDTDFSSSMSAFSNSLNDLLNQPGSSSLRQVVIERAKMLASDLNSIDKQLADFTAGYDTQIKNAADQINRISERIAALNVRIVELEGGGAIGSDAVGLRDERIQLLQELSAYVDVRSSEQASGAVNVFVGGDYLVADGISRKVAGFPIIHDDKPATTEIRLVDTDAPLRVSGGALRGYYDAQSTVSGAFRDSLDEFSRSVIYTMNRLHSEGQGSRGFNSVQGAYSAESSLVPLENSGLKFPVDGGAFEIKIHDATTGLSRTETVFIRQQGLPSDTTLSGLAATINGFTNINASLDIDNRLVISGDTPAITFTFQNDTSGALAALGINNFFKGDSSGSIQVSDLLESDPSMLAISLDGANGGTSNALRLSQAFDAPLADLNGESIRSNFESLIARTAQSISLNKGITDGLQNYFQSLESQHLGITGVNLDEEAIKMMLYQRAFQATSRLIGVASDMLDELVSIIR